VGLAVGTVVEERATEEAVAAAMVDGSEGLAQAVAAQLADQAEAADAVAEGGVEPGLGLGRVVGRVNVVEDALEALGDSLPVRWLSSRTSS